MQIKADGQSYNVTGAGQGTYNTIGASAGILALLQNGALGGILGGNGGNCGCSENMPVNRYELNLTTALAGKDSEIALLKADKYIDQKIVEATAYLEGQINSLAKEVRDNKDAQNAVNMQQAVYNGTNTATLQCLQAQVAQLMGLTKLVVPNTSVCPGWGNVTITPAAATTTPAA